MSGTLKTSDLLAALADPEKGAGRVASIWDQEELYPLAKVLTTDTREEVVLDGSPAEFSEFDSATQIALGVSGTGLAANLLETIGANGQAEYLHVVSNHDTGHTLIVGADHIPDRQLEALEANGIHYVQRGHGLTEAEVGVGLNKVLAETRDIVESNMPIERSVGFALTMTQSPDIYKPNPEGDVGYTRQTVFRYPHEDVMNPDYATRGNLDVDRPKDRTNLTAVLSDKEGYLAQAASVEALRPVALPADLDFDKPIRTDLIKGSGSPYPKEEPAAEKAGGFAAKEDARRGSERGTTVGELLEQRRAQLDQGGHSR